MKNVRNFYLKILIFLVIKFSVYLNRRVFVMNFLFLLQTNISRPLKFEIKRVDCICIPSLKKLIYHCLSWLGNSDQSSKNSFPKRRILT